MKRIFFLAFAIVSVFGMLAFSGCHKEKNYTVTFNANGGVGTMDEQVYVEGEAQALSHNLFTCENHIFAGWNTVADGSGISYTDGQTITVTSDMTLYAQWTSAGNPQTGNSFTITFSPNGGTGAMESLTVVKGESTALTQNAFVYENHIFACWNTVADGSGISYADGQTITPVSDMILYAQWHEYVDLALPSGTKWATTNVGATVPEGYGDYFSWGETSVKDYYSSSTFAYSGNHSTLPASADAATANWGDGWRMPTNSEMQELIDNCTWEVATLNEVNGYRVTGTNGNSIFLPASGCRINSDLYSAGSEATYWVSSRYGDAIDGAWCMFMYILQDIYMLDYADVYYGRSVRAVCVSEMN